VAIFLYFNSYQKYNERYVKKKENSIGH